MNTQSIETDVEAIDEILRQYPWLDMSIVNDDGRDVTIAGSISESNPFDIQIVFVNVQCIAARRDWRTDTSDRVLKEVPDDAEFNRSFHVEQGFRVFELVSEDTESNMRFAAQGVRLVVHRLPPES